MQQRSDFKDIIVYNQTITNAANLTENTVLTFTIPANSITKNGAFWIRYTGTTVNNANTKIFKVKFNSINICQQNFTTSISYQGHSTIHNRNSLSSQVTGGLGGSGTNLGWGTSGVALATYAINTSVDIIVTVTLQHVTATTDNMKLESFKLTAVG